MSGLSHREASGIVSGRQVENDLQKFGWGGMGWIDLAHNRDRWRALVNTLMNCTAGSIDSGEFLE